MLQSKKDDFPIEIGSPALSDDEVVIIMVLVKITAALSLVDYSDVL